MRLSTLAFGLSMALAGNALGASPKKGVGLWSFGGANQALADVNVSWFYMWGPSNYGVTAPSGVQFVPQIWGEKNLNASDIAAAKTTGNVLLGFNEPDHTDQANMTVERALQAWPELMATGQRLGSPAPASNAQKSGSWLDQFMNGVKASNGALRVDFICIHWYGANFDTTTAVNELESYVQATHDKYQLPIWLTEYALTNYSGTPMYPSSDVQGRFATASVAMLESLPYVEKYAWFALPPWNGGTDTVNLYHNDGTPNAAGMAYRAAGLTSTGSGGSAGTGGASSTGTGGVGTGANPGTGGALGTGSALGAGGTPAGPLGPPSGASSAGGSSAGGANNASNSGGISSAGGGGNTVAGPAGTPTFGSGSAGTGNDDAASNDSGGCVIGDRRSHSRTSSAAWSIGLLMALALRRRR